MVLTPHEGHAMARPFLVLIVVAFALGTSVAQAQLPGLRRKVKDAGAGRHGQPAQQHRPPPKFDATMLELNPQVVARLVKASRLAARCAAPAPRPRRAAQALVGRL